MDVYSHKKLKDEINYVIKSFKQRYKIVYVLPEYTGDQYFNVEFFEARRGATQLKQITTYQFQYWTEDDQYEKKSVRIKPQVEIY